MTQSGILDAALTSTYEGRAGDNIYSPCVAYTYVACDLCTVTDNWWLVICDLGLVTGLCEADHPSTGRQKTESLNLKPAFPAEGMPISAAAIRPKSELSCSKQE